MSEARTLLEETAHRLLADQVTPALLVEAESGRFARALWSALDDAGLTRAMASEADGGSALDWPDAGVLLTAQGYHLAPVPLGETLLAHWLARKAGLRAPSGIATVVDATGAGSTLAVEGSGLDTRLSGAVAEVPWADVAENYVVAARHRGRLMVLVLERDSARREPGTNMAKEPRSRVHFAGAAPAAHGEAALEPETAARMMALVRAGQMAGALARVLDFTTRYANERKQFGKPIGKFQAIQQQIAELATEVASAHHAARIAFEAADSKAALLAIATAKIRAGEAAAKVNAIAHQVHGAIGFTYEHPLHFATRRLWAWRGEAGAEREWAIRLGREAARRGGEGLWPYLVGR